MRDFVSDLFDEADRARTVVTGGTAVKNLSIFVLLPLFAAACAASPNFGDDTTDDSGTPDDDDASRLVSAVAGRTNGSEGPGLVYRVSVWKNSTARGFLASH